ncbi:cytochrome c class I [Thiothrix lacustris]|jgi:cytochrome c553|uniref:Cytochrome c class I n=1 Tax=Thiothrix lacustris TaxID=525917 RepID=A0ABY9MMA2_9GAMM|nr:c-type cytochrome [Thiothrix lacustris]WML89667.1 cytochrome c class I [Thiothrix lacustris]
MKASINIPLVFALGVLLTACGGGTTSSGSSVNNITTASIASTAPVISAPDGARLLASQCFQCHGMNGNSASGIEGIGGDSAAELVSEMLEMKYSTDVNDIMHRQAMGYSEDQIRSIATYLAALPKGSNGGND